MKEKSLLTPSCTVTQVAAAVQTLIAYINLRHGLPAPDSNGNLSEFHRRDPGLCLARGGKKKGCVPLGRACRLLRNHQRFFQAKDVRAAQKAVA